MNLRNFLTAVTLLSLVLIVLKVVGLSLTRFFLDSPHAKLIIGLSVRIFFLGVSLVLFSRYQPLLAQRIKIARTKWIGLAALLLFVVLLLTNAEGDLSLAGDPSLYLLFVAYVVSVALFEEMLFRVLVFAYILENVVVQSRCHTRLAVLITSLLFGFAHIRLSVGFSDTINQVLIAICIGIILQSVFVKFGNLLMVVVLHAAFNYAGSFRTFFAPTDSPSAGDRSAVLSAVFFLFLCAFSLAVMLLMVPPDSAKISPNGR